MSNCPTPSSRWRSTTLIDALLIDAAQFRRARRDLQATEIERLRGELALQQWHLPLLPVAGMACRDVAKLAAALRAPA